jgi:hypothetical protein
MKNEREMFIDGVAYAWSVEGGIVSIRGPLGRQKSTQVGGGKPEVVARMVAGWLRDVRVTRSI